MTVKPTTGRRDDAQLQVARAAAQLFIEKGFALTSGGDIATASGVSERTVWRYFRNKESCVAPLFALVLKRFALQLQRWPRHLPIEAHLAECFDLEKQSAEQIADGILIVKLIATMPEEPDLRSVWLLAYYGGEKEMAAIIGDRMDRSHNDFDVRLCAAAVMSAMRTIDETISIAAFRDRQVFTTPELVAQMARAIRAVSTLPFCDPVTPKPFGDARPS